MISIGTMVEEYSGSSLLSDCTSGLVGALKTKVEENEDDNEAAIDGVCGSGIGLDAEDNWVSSWKGVKLRGGEVESHDGGDKLYSGSPVSTTPCLLKPCGTSGLSCVKSPECNADLGRSIDNPACRFSFSALLDDLDNSLISAEGNRGGERALSAIGLRAKVLESKSWSIDSSCEIQESVNEALLLRVLTNDGFKKANSRTHMPVR